MSTSQDTPIHDQPHPYAGQLVPLLGQLNDGTPVDWHPRAMFRINDWADRVYGMPWRRQRNTSVLLYSARAQQLGLPIHDNHVIHGTLLGIPLLIHSREIDWTTL